MSLINKILDDLKQERNETALLGLRSPRKIFSSGNLVLIGVCMTITLLLGFFVGGNPVSEKNPEPTLSQEPVSASEGRRQAEGGAGREVSTPASSAGISSSPGAGQRVDAPAPAVAAIAVSARTQEEMAAAVAGPEAARHAGLGRSTSPLMNNRLPAERERSEKPPESALTREETLYVPVYSYGSAEKAYAAGKRAFIIDGNNETALNYLRQALVLDPGHLAARELLAELYHKVLRRDREAIRVLEAGIEMAPEHTAFARKLSAILAARGDYQSAAGVLLSNGLPNIRKDREALEALASLYVKLDEPYLAAQTYRTLLIEQPANGSYWFSLGAALEAQQQTDAAIGSYQKALGTSNLGRELSERARGRLGILMPRSSAQ